MRKKFTFLFGALCALMIMISLPGKAVGQEKTNYVINTTNFTNINGGSGYAAYDGDHLINGITINSSNVMVQSSKLQFKKSVNAALYNKTAIPGVITKITLETSTNFTIYVGTSQNPSSTTVTSGSTISGSYTYFKVVNATKSTATTATITVEYTPTHTITYSATNGSIGGVLYGTSTAVASGGAVAEGGKVTLTATPSTGYSFSSWSVSGTGSSLTSTSTNPTTFTMGTANATVTATFVAAGNYINVTPNPANVAVGGGSTEFSVTTDQTLTASNVQFYTAATSGSTTTKPGWIGTIVYDGSSSPKTLTVPVSENTGVARSAYFTLKKNAVESSVVTINQAAITVADPEFDEEEGTYYEDLLVDISCDTQEATIKYTVDGTEPSSSVGTEYDGNGVAISEGTTTLKAIAIKNGVSSSVVSATYTVMYPLTTMSDIFTAATSAGNTPTDVCVTFNNWAVVYTTNTKAYVTDGQYGLVIYASSHGFTKGKKYSGTTACKVQLYDGGAELTNLTYASSGLTQSDAGSLTPYEVSLATICGENGGKYLGSYVNLGVLSYNGSAFTDGENTITPYAGITLPTLTNGKTYIVKGVYYIYSSSKQITQYVEGDIVEYTAPSIVPSPLTSLAVPNYIYTAPENAITYETLTVNGSHLQENITVTLEKGENSDFVMSTDLETWGHSITLTQSDGSVTNEEIAVRLKVGKSIADYSDRIVLTSTNATTVNVNVTGSVTYAQVTYNGNGSDGGTVPTDNTNYEYNDDVTVAGAGTMTRTGYDFNGWATEAGGGGTSYSAGGTFKITADVTLYAKWTAKSYNLHTAAMTNGSVSFTVGGAAATTATTGQEVTLVITPATNYGLQSLTVTNETTSATVSVSDNKFTMPGSDVMVSATFKPVKIDELTYSLIGVTGNSYVEWTNKYDNSDARYAGKTAGGYSAIQLRDKKDSNTPGIVTTTSGGKVKKVSVVWNENTTSGRYITIYGKNAPYTGYSDLYSETPATVGTPLGTITCETTTELTFDSDYSFIGIKASDPLYLDKITITWAPPTYTVTYNANGGQGSMSDPNSPYVEGETVTVLANDFTYTDKVFSRWNTDSEGAGTYYTAGDNFTMPKSNLTLYAQWIEPCSNAPTMDDVVLDAAYKPGQDRIELGMLSAIKTLIAGCPVTEYGFVYSTTNTTPTIGGSGCTKVVVGTSYTVEETDFETSIESAELGARYYVRSYAINGAPDPAYSDVESIEIDSAYPTWTISYSTNGKAEASTTVINQGNTISGLIEPTSANVPNGYTFKGWKVGDYTLSNTPPTFVNNGDAISGNMALKAVFATGVTAEGEFTKSYGWEDADDASVWTITDAIAKTGGQGYGSSTYAGRINTYDTYVTFNTKVKVKEFSFAFKKTSNNDNYNVFIETSSDGDTWSAIETYPMSDFDNGTYRVKTKTFDGNTKLYVRFHCNQTTAVRYVDDVTIKYYAEYTTYYNYCTSVSDATAISGTITDGHLTSDGSIAASTAVYLKTPLTINSGKTLTVNGSLGCDDPENLIIEDGGQLILNNTNSAVQATVRKTTAASSAKVTSAWNAISSSVDNVAISSFIQDESVSQNQHNVYQYDEATVYWQEYRNTSNAFSNLTNGRGYLYRSLISGVEFSGDVNVGNIDCSGFLSYECEDYGGRYQGFNLIGNPFTHDITWSNITDKENISVDGYYTLKSDGTWNTQTTGGTIAPMQAFLIQATGTSPKLKIANIVGKGDDDRFGGDQIMFNVENSEYSDVAYVLFKKGHGLNKIEHRNDKTPMLYIINEDGDYAIADMPDNTSVINLGFEAKTMGQYKLSLKAEGQYSYMHLVDKLTGEDVDMLIEDYYSFIGSPSDRKDRFVLRLKYNAAGIDTDSDIFAYQSGSDILVSGEGELQIFDVMGRLVMNQRISGVETVNGLEHGVYIFKLEGKTQKIVVR